MTSAERCVPRVRATAAIGAAGWALMLASGVFSEVGDALVALGVACVVPIGATLGGEETRTSRLAMNAVSVAAPLALASFLVPAGTAAGLAAVPWLVATLLLALAGAARVARRGVLPLEELAIDLGHLYVPVGGVWLLASRCGYALLGFHEPIVLYTANHFHFAGFAAPLVMGLVGRELGLRRAPGEHAQRVSGALVRRLYALSTSIVLAGIPLVAAGIQLSHVLELPAAVVLGAGMLGASALLVIAGARRLGARGMSGLLLVLAGASLVLSMTFAVLFAFTGSATRGADVPWIPYSTMALVHGVANAVGFASLSLLAFSIVPAPRRSGPFGGTWPSMFGRGFIGADFFDRTGAIDPEREVVGQLGSLDDFAHASFAPARVHDAVRDFYERTSAYDLHVAPEWQVPFRAGGIVFAWIARKILGQLELPTRPEGDELVTTRLFAVRATLDGRDAPRGYVRTLSSSDGARANYVAAYATHRAPDRLLLSTSFPLPFAALNGVLRFDDGPRSGGLALSSRPRAGEGPSDEGMFLVTSLGPVRLPFDERIQVWFDDARGVVLATHVVHVFGLHAFTLHYTITKKGSSSRA